MSSEDRDKSMAEAWTEVANIDTALREIHIRLVDKGHMTSGITSTMESTFAALAELRTEIFVMSDNRQN